MVLVLRSHGYPVQVLRCHLPQLGQLGVDELLVVCNHTRLKLEDLIGTAQCSKVELTRNYYHRSLLNFIASFHEDRLPGVDGFLPPS